jgi:hypothetical protein
MIKVARTYTRPDPMLPWHLDQPFESTIYTPEFKTHVQQNYGNSLVFLQNSLSEDKST